MIFRFNAIHRSHKHDWSYPLTSFQVNLACCRLLTHCLKWSFFISVWQVCCVLRSMYSSIDEIFIHLGPGRSQLCPGTAENDRCSTNIGCGCLKMAGAVDIGICGFRYMSCSQLIACEKWTNNCYEPDSVCVHYPRCFSYPVCLSAHMIDERICPPMQSKRAMDYF